MIDHILVSQTLLDGKDARVFAYHEYSIGCLSRPSDHWPLVLDLRLTNQRDMRGLLVDG